MPRGCITTSSACPTCGKSFKNLQEHITKAHDTFTLRGVREIGKSYYIQILRNGAVEHDELTLYGLGDGMVMFANKAGTALIYTREVEGKEVPIAVHKFTALSRGRGEKVGPKLFAQWTWEPSPDWK